MRKPTTRRVASWTALVVAGLGLSLTAGALVRDQGKPAVIKVAIDVKPGDEPTTIEPKREGMVPIAILTTKEFDATRVDVATVRAGAKGTEAPVFRSATEDVDDDRDVDLLMLFRVQQLALECDGKSVVVKGKTTAGQEFEGSEAVTMEGCK